MNQDLISRQAAIAVADSSDYVGLSVEDVKKVTDEVVKGLKRLPSAQPEHLVKESGNLVKGIVNDSISRQAAIDALSQYPFEKVVNCISIIEELPSAQPEPISEEYAKAVRTWLINYQVRCAELNGRYTPYEILGWIVSDWRKENEIW